MFTVIGHDQKEYGPITADQLRDWIRQGRLNATSRCRAAGATDWKPLSEFPEFAGDLPGAPQLPSLAAMNQTPAPIGPQTSGLAIASLVMGVLGLFSCGITSLAGVILGPIALSKIKGSNGQLGGRNLAIAGIALSVASLLIIPIVGMSIMLPSFGKARGKAATIRCMNNAKMLALGTVMYATDFKDTLPAGNAWCDQLMPYVQTPQSFQCASSQNGQRAHFAINVRLAGVKTTDIKNPANTVLIFETEGGWNLSGGPELLLKKPRHATVTVGFADGHVEMVTPSRLSGLNWTP